MIECAKMRALYSWFLNNRWPDPELDFEAYDEAR